MFGLRRTGWRWVVWHDQRSSANFRMQATAGGLRAALIQGEASPAAPDPERYPVVRLCLASLSAHGESAPGQFMVGLR
jgi:hypothetical protein